MVDLKSQYDKIKTEIDQVIQQVLDHSQFINGPEVTHFSENLEDYLHVKHVIPCGNGTDALQIALMALSLNPGDEIITTPFTFIATAEVIELLHLKPVFVDIDPNTFNIDVSKIEEAITSKTKVILPVHLFGQSCDMETIMNIAKQYQLYVIEDSCQSMGTESLFSDGRRKKSGTIGNIGCTSFYPSKNLGCFGDGGAIFTQHPDLASTCKMITNHGSTQKYYHDRVGVNSRLDTIQAAILDVKLKYLDYYISERQKVAHYYTQHLQCINEIQTPQIASYTTHTFHQYTLKTNPLNRDQIVQDLKANGIPCMIYYPVPLHLQEAFRHWGYSEGDFPVCEEVSKSVFSLPIHTELTDEQLEVIVNIVKTFSK
jgi:UDP-2-acetamido-2-deoxy-ribo-hexuluronate aminotransferase